MESDQEIIIIGCGAGGGTAAQFARKTNRKVKITIFEKEQYPQYSKCGLPYAISKDIPSFNDLIEFSKEWFNKNNIDLQLNTKIEKINPEKQIINIKKENKTFEKKYDKLIIATGAKPSVPNIENIFSDKQLISGINYIHTINDAKQITNTIKQEKKAVIIGAGLIGLEIADVFYNKKLKVILIEALPSILPNTFDEDIAETIQNTIPDKIKIYTNHTLTKIKHKNKTITQVIIYNNETKQKQTIDTDILLIATGTKPNTTLAKQAEIKIGKTGGIIVNEKTQTSQKNIYAVGDCTEYKDFITQKPTLIGLGSIAVRQGIAAGTNAAGQNYQLPKGVLQTRTSHFFNKEIAAVGPTTKQLKETPIVLGKIKGSTLPDYYPGGQSITIKLIAHKNTGQILAAQALGPNAAQRINTIACAILNKMTIEKFRKLETAYAPPIAPTLDVITLVCDIIAKKISHFKR